MENNLGGAFFRTGTTRPPRPNRRAPLASDAEMSNSLRNARNEFAQAHGDHLPPWVDSVLSNFYDPPREFQNFAGQAHRLSDDPPVYGNSGGN